MPVLPRSWQRLVLVAVLTVVVVYILRLTVTVILPTQGTTYTLTNADSPREFTGKPSVQIWQPVFVDKKPAKETEEQDSDADTHQEQEQDREEEEEEEEEKEQQQQEQGKEEVPKNTQNGDAENKPGSDAVISESDTRKAKVSWDQLGTMATADDKGWSPRPCNTSQTLRRVVLPTKIGNLTIYVYGQASEDLSVTARALRGEIFERGEIVRFLELSRDLPLIDVGANVGLVTLQAAIQGRQVVALEPIADNAVRLCRAAQDFGFKHLVHVVQNAISETEGPVTLAMDTPKQSTHFTMTKGGRFGRTSAYAIKLDHILDVLHFKTAALKIDVEGFEGHVLAGADKLFQEVDIPLVWLEWEHVKKLPEFGGQLILDFMHKHNMTPYNLMSNKKLNESNWKYWPFTVLWKSEKSGGKY